MIKIVESGSLQSLEEKVDDVINSIDLPVQDVKVDIHQFKDFYEDGRICNQWTEYVAVIMFKR